MPTEKTLVAWYLFPAAGSVGLFRWVWPGRAVWL